jgi:hypothetical protein
VPLWFDSVAPALIIKDGKIILSKANELLGLTRIELQMRTTRDETRGCKWGALNAGQAWKHMEEEVNRSDWLFGKWVFDLTMAQTTMLRP